MEKIEITTEMMSNLRDHCSAIDQRKALRPGDETWGIMVDGQRGQMSRYANGRGAIETGGDSAWGDWDGKLLHLDGGLHVVNGDGMAVD